MLEETARVIQVEDDSVWVETQRSSMCSSCSVEQGCGTALLAKFMGSRRTRVRALAKPGFKPGDEVIIGIQEQALVKGSIAVYMVPLLALLLGALAGTLAANNGLTANSDLSAIGFGLIGFFASLAWLRRFTRRIKTDPRFQPVVLRRVLTTGAH